MKIEHKKLLLVIVIIGAVICSLSAFLLQKKQNFLSSLFHKSYQGKTEKIIAATIGEYSSLTYLAKEKGYFQENGLDVETREYVSGPPAVADLLAGKVDMATAADFVGVRNIYTNKDLRILAQAAEAESFFLVADRKKGIQTAADLKGKRIGVTKKTAGEFYFERFLTLKNIPLSNVQLVDLSVADIDTQITEGKIDGGITFDPHIYNVKKQLGKDAVVFSIQGRQKLFSLLYTTSQTIKNNPDAVNRYIRSLKQAETYLNEHNTEGRDTIGKILKYDSQYLQYFWPKFSFDLTLSQQLLISMEDEARWTIENKLTPETHVPNYLSFISKDALQKAKPNGVKLVTQ